MHAAIEAADQPTVKRVVMGEAADRMLNGRLGLDTSVDIVAVEESGTFQLAEAKGTDTAHAIEQLKHSARQLGVHSVTRYTIYTGRKVGAGYYIQNGLLYRDTGVPVQIYHTDVNVVLTAQ